LKGLEKAREDARHGCPETDSRERKQMTEQEQMPTSIGSEAELALPLIHRLSCATGDNDATEIETGGRFSDTPYIWSGT